MFKNSKWLFFEFLDIAIVLFVVIVLIESLL